MHQINRTFPLFVALLLAMLAAACAPAPAPQPQAVPPSPTPLSMPTSAPAVSSSSSSSSSSPTEAAAPSADEVSGASLYQISCAACHGQDRGGSDFEMDGQKISVPALAWDDLSSMYAGDTSRGTVEQQLALAITKGEDETGDQLEPMMPHWSSLSQSQVDSLIEFIKAGGSVSATDSLSPAAAGLMGKQLFEAACAACHGSDGAGKTFEMDGNKIDTPALSWSDLSSTYSDASRGTVEQQLALAITKGEDEEGSDLEPMMPRWSFLSQAQVDSLVQYLQTTFP